MLHSSTDIGGHTCSNAACTREITDVGAGPQINTARPRPSLSGQHENAQSSTRTESTQPQHASCVAPRDCAVWDSASQAASQPAWQGWAVGRTQHGQFSTPRKTHRRPYQALVASNRHFEHAQTLAASSAAASLSLQAYGSNVRLLRCGGPRLHLNYPKPQFL